MLHVHDKYIWTLLESIIHNLGIVSNSFGFFFSFQGNRENIYESLQWEFEISTINMNQNKQH